jgi:hypothetical protein
MVGDKDPGVVAHVLQFLLVAAEVHLIYLNYDLTHFINR